MRRDESCSKASSSTLTACYGYLRRILLLSTNRMRLRNSSHKFLSASNRQWKYSWTWEMFFGKGSRGMELWSRVECRTPGSKSITCTRTYRLGSMGTSYCRREVLKLRFLALCTHRIKLVRSWTKLGFQVDRQFHHEAKAWQKFQRTKSGMSLAQIWVSCRYKVWEYPILRVLLSPCKFYWRNERQEMLIW